MRPDPADLIRAHWRKVHPVRRAPVKINPWEHSFSNTPHGLGDCIILSDMPHAAGRPFGVHSHSPAWPAVEGMLLTGTGEYREKWVYADRFYMEHDLGNGHLFQRFRRLWEIDVDPKPSGKLRLDFPVVKNRVGLHFDAGKHSEWQKRHIHARAREVYPENLAIIQDWVTERHDLEFLQFGSLDAPFIEGAKDCRGIELGLALRALSTCSRFLGIVSGFMHAAAAFGQKGLVVLNFPHARKIVLPTCVDTNEIESEWLYPQFAHLHQDNQSELIPRFTARNLRAAWNHETYPYDSDEFLPLIFEDLASRPVAGVDLPGGGRGRHRVGAGKVSVPQG